MLRELFAYLLPLVLQTAPINPNVFPPFDETNYSWSLRVVKVAEDALWFPKNREYAGWVIALTNDTMTVRLRHRIPRTFSIAPPLLSGDVALQGGPGTGHRFQAVQVGDFVDLDVVPVRDGLVCYAVGIGRRPGGVIPPDENPTGIPERNRRHHYYNAVQAVEERLLPLLPMMLTCHPLEWFVK